MYKDRWLDQILKRICLALCSIPTFWIGIVFLMFFSVMLGWFLAWRFQQAFPARKLPYGEIASFDITCTQLSLLSLPTSLHTGEDRCTGSDYVLFAKARGDSPMRCLCRHGLRNTMMPAITCSLRPSANSSAGLSLQKMSFPILDWGLRLRPRPYSLMCHYCWELHSLAHYLYLPEICWPIFFMAS